MWEDRQKALATGRDEPLLVVARDIVKVDAVEAHRGVLVQPRGVPLDIRRDAQPRDHILARHAGGCAVEVRREVAELVACQRRLPPLIEGGGPGFAVGAGIRQSGLQEKRLAGAAAVAKRVDDRAHGLARRRDGDEGVRPSAGPARRFSGERGRDDERRLKRAVVDARATRTWPPAVTSSPAHSARMTSIDAFSRAVRSSLPGQGAPVICSLSASPLPTASQKRPAYISASVAAAWAITAG